MGWVGWVGWVVGLGVLGRLSHARRWRSADDGKRWYSDGRFISKGEMIFKKWRGGLGERLLNKKEHIDFITLGTN